jgi:virginiamycin B lyase
MLRRAGLGMVAALAGFATLAWAEGPVIHRYPIPTPECGAAQIGSGYNGLWFAESAGNRVSRMDYRGAITEIPLPHAGSGPFAVTETSFGRDGNSFAFTEVDGNRIGVVNASGILTEYEIPTPASGVRAIASDGSFAWFAEFESDKIGRLDLDRGAIVEFSLPWPRRGPVGIAPGWGGFWFTELYGNRIGFASNEFGRIVEYRIPTPGSLPTVIREDGNGGAWFVESAANRIGHIASDGVITEYEVPTPDAGLEDISIGKGQAWFTERRVGKIGRILRDGSVREYALPEGSEPVGLTIGDDGSVWYTDTGTNTIGRLSGNTFFAVGAGSVGVWDTEFEVVSESGQPEQVYVGVYPPPSVCPGQCFYPAVFLETPAGVRGTARASEIPFWDRDGVWTFMISAWRGDYPVLDTAQATARIVNRARPEQTAELPLVDYWTMFDAQPPVTSRERDTPRPTLTLPARRGIGAHTNLVVADIEGESLFVRIDFVDATGVVVRTMSPRGALHTGQTELFVNVLGTGVPDDFDGSIRITRLSPSGLFWATLANVYADGRLELLAPAPGMSLDMATLPGGVR